LLRRAFCPREARVGHAHHHVGLASSHVLALPTVTLALEERISRGLIPDRAAVTTAFDFHDCPPCLRLWGHATSGSACALVLAYPLPADLRTSCPRLAPPSMMRSEEPHARRPAASAPRHRLAAHRGDLPALSVSRRAPLRSRGVACEESRCRDR